MNHGKKLGVIVAFDIYLECCEGNLHPLWKVEKPVSFHRFREKLGLQMVQYSPSNQHYPGDEKLRANTVLPKKRRRSLLSPSRSVAGSAATDTSGVSAEFLAEETNRGRLCGFLGHLQEHIQSVQPIPNKGKQNCHVCGEKAHQLCSICHVPLHYSNPPKNESIKVPCFFLYHDTGFCGLARADWKKLGSPVNDWKLKDAAISKHSTAIRDLSKSLNKSSANMASSGSGDKDGEAEWNDRCV